MSSPLMFAPRSSVSERFPPHDDAASLRLTPTPVGPYRCPVSTPANYVPCAGKIRRTKPLDTFKQPSQAARGPPSNRPQRARLTGLTRPTRAPQAVVPRGSAGIDYYYVDKKENVREEQVTNTRWLKALCAQPVEEILGKYRRKTDFRRSRVTMVRACSTPGERSLVTAWESNLSRHHSSGNTLRVKPMTKSAVLRPSGTNGKRVGRGGKQKETRAVEASLDHRATKSEPPLSPVSPSRLPNSARNSHCRSTPRTEEDEVQNTENVTVPPGSPVQIPAVRGFLLDQDETEEDGRTSKQGSPRAPNRARFVSFTTQIYRETDEQGRARTYSKVTRGPEHLPYLSNNKRVNSMLYNTCVFQRPAILTSTSAPKTPDNQQAQLPEYVQPPVDNKIPQMD